MPLSTKPLARWLPTRSQGPAVLYCSAQMPSQEQRGCSVCHQAGWGRAIPELGDREREDCLPLPARLPCGGFLQAPWLCGLSYLLSIYKSNVAVHSGLESLS